METSPTFLEVQALQWENDSSYNFLKKTLSKMQVVYDSAERAILLAKIYHNKLTTNPNETSHLYQVVPMLRRKIPYKRKSTLLKTNLVDDIPLRNPFRSKNVVTLKYTTIRNFINFFLFGYSAYTWRTLPLKWLMMYCKISSNAKFISKTSIFLKHVLWNFLSIVMWWLLYHFWSKNVFFNIIQKFD